MNKYTVTISGYFKVVKVIEAESIKEARDAVIVALYDNELKNIMFNHENIEVFDVTDDASLLPLS